MTHDEELNDIARSLGLKSKPIGAAVTFEAQPETMHEIGHLVGDHFRLLNEVQGLRDLARDLRIELQRAHVDLSREQRAAAACRNLFAIVLALGHTHGRATVSKLVLVEVRDSRLTTVENPANGDVEIIGTIVT